MSEDYEKCIIRNGKEISCIYRNWSVCGENIEKEAYHYWTQYAEQGYYSKIIGGDNEINYIIKQLNTRG
jgi:hypothetical protein